MKLIPDKLLPFFEMAKESGNQDNMIIEGVITCCNAYDFEVYASGRIKSNLFSRMSLYPEKEQAAIGARCKKCGRVISIFDSHSDGYGRLEEKGRICTPQTPVRCAKCLENNFSITIKYEYPDSQELQELGISEKGNAFTWIWITLTCCSCKMRYGNFVDFDTT